MDTIVFSVHNMGKEEYAPIRQFIQELKGGKGIIKAPGTKENLAIPDFRNFFYSVDRGIWKIMRHNANMKLPSSASGVNISLDDVTEIARFECSMPKALFANNVIEIFPPATSNYHNPSYPTMLRMAKFWFRFIHKFIDSVLFELTEGHLGTVSKTDIEINRLDICYNQLFDTEADCKNYLQGQKKLKIKRVGLSKQVVYETGLAAFGENYFKVYHKGPDFYRTGAKQIRKYFDMQNKAGILDQTGNLALSMLHLQELQDYANRILRYELKLSTKVMSALFNGHLKKRNFDCPRGRKHKSGDQKGQYVNVYHELNTAVEHLMRDENRFMMQALKIHYRDNAGNLHKQPQQFHTNTEYSVPYSLLDSTDERRGYTKVDDPRTIARIERLLDEKEMLRKRYAIKTPKDMQAIYSFLRTEQAKHHKFFLETDEVQMDKAFLKVQGVHVDDPRMFAGLFDESPIDQKFTIALLFKAIKHFYKYFEQYQLQELPDDEKIKEAVEEYNRRVDAGELGKGKWTKARPARIIHLVNQLKNSSFDELKNNNTEVSMQHRSTHFRNSKTLAAIFSLDKTVNFIDGSKLETVCRTASDMYQRHYTELILVNSPLLLFLQNTRQLLLV